MESSADLHVTGGWRLAADLAQVSAQSGDSSPYERGRGDFGRLVKEVDMHTSTSFTHVDNYSGGGPCVAFFYLLVLSALYLRWCLCS